MTREVPRILRLSRDHAGAGHSRFALLHVVSGERHHLGWFELSDDAWRVGLTSAGVVADAGVPPEAVRAETESLLARLRAAHDAGELDVPEPVGPIVNTLRFSVDRGRAIDRLAGELAELEAP
jgi:hypothetical protein